MIEINRNSMIIRDVDLNSKEYKKFRNKFSVYDNVSHKYTMEAYTLIGNDIYIPATVSSAIIQGYFPKKNVITNYMNTSKTTEISYRLKNAPRDDLQREAVKNMLNITRDINRRHRMLSLATGKGKTYIMINVISQLQKKPFIFVDTGLLADQWKAAFLTHSDLKSDEICILSGADSVKEASTNKKYKVYIAIHRTIGTMLENDNNSLNSLFNKLKIGIKIFDEAHAEFKNICNINSLTNTEYTFFLTATPGRSAYREDNLFSKIYKSIPYFNGKHIENDKYHTVMLMEFNSQPNDIDRSAVKTKYGINASNWAKYIISDSWDLYVEMMEKILNMIFKYGDRKIALILPTIDMIKKTKKILEEIYPDIDIGLLIGEVKKTEDREAAKQKKFIITNDKIFDKAIDIQDLEVLINFVPLSSTLKLEQIIGRLRYVENKITVMIDVTDVGFKELVNQQKIRKRFYKTKAKKIINISLKKENN